MARPQGTSPRYDLIVVGGGIAGLFAALCAAGDGRVALVSKGSPLSSASWLAQGGIAAPPGAGGSPGPHAPDTPPGGRGGRGGGAAGRAPPRPPPRRGGGRRTGNGHRDRGDGRPLAANDEPARR